MKNLFLLFVCVAFSTQALLAQDKDDKSEKKGFKKENLFTGGSISLSYFNEEFLVGANPVFGYSVAKWADVGLVGNYNYTSIRDYSYYGSNDKLRQYVYGGGAFARLFPVRFLFVQGQVEHNWIKEKYIDPTGVTTETSKVSANSVLIGGGFTTGRDPYFKRPYGFLAVLFDVSNNPNSPYLDNLGRAIPVFRAGVNIPLFQGYGGRRRY